MKECSNCGRNDGTHAPGCFRGWTVENAPPTYEQLAAEAADLRTALQRVSADRDTLRAAVDTYAAELARVSAERDKLREQLREAAFIPRG